MLGSDIKIAHQVEDARWDLGKPVPYMRIEFYVGTHGPFTVRVPLAEYTADERDRRVEEYARQIRVT